MEDILGVGLNLTEVGGNYNYCLFRINLRNRQAPFAVGELKQRASLLKRKPYGRSVTSELWGINANAGYNFGAATCVGFKEHRGDRNITEADREIGRKPKKELVTQLWEKIKRLWARKRWLEYQHANNLQCWEKQNFMYILYKELKKKA